MHGLYLGAAEEILIRCQSATALFFDEMLFHVKSLTHIGFRSIFIAIFRKGAFLMNMYGFVSMLTANTETHVRTIVVYDHCKFREA